MPEPPTFYRHRLPHIQLSNARYFINFRLANTIPQDVLKQLTEDRHREEQLLQRNFSGPAGQNLRDDLHKKYLGRYDAWLDRCAHGPDWLKEGPIAEIVVQRIRDFDSVRYHLLSYCIMPNHVHLLIDTTGNSYPLSETLRLIKGNTARECNQILGQSGAFWHPESYDHVVRDDRELERIIRYILANPVKAGLVQEWKAWKFTYINPESGDW